MKLKETGAAAGLSGPAKCMLKSKPKAKQAKPCLKGFPHFLKKKTTVITTLVNDSKHPQFWHPEHTSQIPICWSIHHASDPCTLCLFWGCDRLTFLTTLRIWARIFGRMN